MDENIDNRKASKLKLPVAILAMVAAGIVFQPGLAGAQQNYDVGTVNSLTGPFATIGRPLVAGADTYFKMINDQGGVNGQKIVLTALDDQLNPDIGVANARQLIAGGTRLLLAPISSGVSGALLPVLDESGVPMIAYTGVEAMESNENYFAVGLDTTQAMTVAANYIKSTATGTPKIAFYTYESPASATARETVKGVVERWGWPVVAMESYKAGSAGDYTTQALKLAAAQPDYIISSLIDGQATAIFDSLRRVGNKAVVVNFHAGSSEGVFKEIADPLFLAVRDVPAPSEGDEALKPMLEAAQKYGATDSMISNVFTKGWISGMLTVEAFKDCGSGCTSDAIKAKLLSLTAFDTHGLTAPISFAADKRVGLSSGRVYQWNAEKGKALAITDFLPASAD